MCLKLTDEAKDGEPGLGRLASSEGVEESEGCIYDVLEDEELFCEAVISF
jgi:hypothetical protein